MVASRRGWQSLWSLQTPSSTGCAILRGIRDKFRFRRPIVIYGTNANISDAEISRNAARTPDTFGHVGSVEPKALLLALKGQEHACYDTSRHVEFRRYDGDARSRINSCLSKIYVRPCGVSR